MHCLSSTKSDECLVYLCIVRGANPAYACRYDVTFMACLTVSYMCVLQYTHYTPARRVSFLTPTCNNFLYACVLLKQETKNVSGELHKNIIICLCYQLLASKTSLVSAKHHHNLENDYEKFNLQHEPHKIR